MRGFNIYVIGIVEKNGRNDGVIFEVIFKEILLKFFKIEESWVFSYRYWVELIYVY